MTIKNSRSKLMAKAFKSVLRGNCNGPVASTADGEKRRRLLKPPLSLANPLGIPALNLCLRLKAVSLRRLN